MKKLSYLVCSALLCLLAACGSDNDETPDPIKLDKSEQLVFEADGGTLSISMTNYDYWYPSMLKNDGTDIPMLSVTTEQRPNDRNGLDTQYTAEYKWMRAVVPFENPRTLTVTLQPNETGQERTLELVMFANYINVIQNGKLISESMKNMAMVTLSLKQKAR